MPSRRSPAHRGLMQPFATSVAWMLSEYLSPGNTSQSWAPVFAFASSRASASFRSRKSASHSAMWACAEGGVAMAAGSGVRNPHT